MNETKTTTLRRAVTLTVAAGALAAGAVMAAPLASADTSHQSSASVLMKVTPTDDGAATNATNSCCFNDACPCKPK